MSALLTFSLILPLGTLQPLDVGALEKWITASGGFVGPVAAKQHGGYRGLFCTRDGVRAGEPLLAVPRSCTIRGAAIKDKRPIETLVAALLAASDAGAASEFASLAIHCIENEYLNGETIRIDGAIRFPSGCKPWKKPSKL